MPALPSFKLHKFVSQKVVDRGYDYRTGVVYTTNRRVWEHDDELPALPSFKLHKFVSQKVVARLSSWLASKP